MTTSATDTEGSAAHPVSPRPCGRWAWGRGRPGPPLPEATRTAAEAAAALGCELSQICKSLIFAADGEPLLVLMDGASRVDLDRVREELGADRVTRAKADVVRETTGYAIGGVPPSATAPAPASSPTAPSSPTP